MSNNNPYLPSHRGNYYPISFTLLPYDILSIKAPAMPPFRYIVPILSPTPTRPKQNFSTARSRITKPLNASEATIKKIQELIIDLKLTGAINGELLIDTWCSNFKTLRQLPIDKLIGEAREVTKALKDSLPENFNNFIETLSPLITLFHKDSILLTCKLIQLQEKHPQIRCHALDSIIEKILNEYHASSHSGKGLAYLKKSISEYVIYLVTNKKFFNVRKILNAAVESKFFKQYDYYYTEALNKYIFQLNAYEGNYPIDTGSLLNKSLTPEIVYNGEWAKIFELSLLVAEKLLTPFPLATILPLSTITEVFDKTREDKGKAIGIMILVKLASLPLSKTQENALNNLLAPHHEETVTRRLEISETDYVQCIDSIPPENQLIAYFNLIKFHSKHNNLDLTLFYIKHLLSVKNSFPNFEAQRSCCQELFFTSINRFLEQPTTEATHCYTISATYSLLSCKSFLNIFESRQDQKMQLIYNAIILGLSNKSHRVKNEIIDLTAIFFSESNIENTKVELKNLHVLAQRLPKLVLFEALIKSKPMHNNETLINLTQEACKKLNANKHHAKAINLAEHYNIYTLELAQEFLTSGSYNNDATQYFYSWRYFLNTLDRKKNNSNTENILLYNCWNKALINLRKFDARQLKDTINSDLHLDKILSLDIELAKKEHLLIHLTRIYLEASKQSKNNKIYLKKALNIRSLVNNKNMSCNVLNLDCDIINQCGIKLDREFLTTLIPLIINVTDNLENSSQLLKCKAAINNVCKGIGNNIYTSEDLSRVIPFIERVIDIPRTIKV
ncbi:MAG: hypothetical protein VX777_01475, partial [Chlamydiota bacterium]|nr:hypothetical protein [Chlamydiota bacterium]